MLDPQPPVILVMGDQNFLRERLIRSLVNEAHTRGWMVDKVEDDPHSLVAVLSSSIFISQPRLVVCTNPTKGTLERIQAHEKSPGTTTVLINNTGIPRANSALAKMADRLKRKSLCKRAKAPPSYKEDEFATEFCVAEAKGYGLKMDPKLAQVLVHRIGANLGYLSFELQKAALLAQSDDVEEIGPKQLMTMATLLEQSLKKLSEAIQSADKKRVVKSLGRIRDSRNSDPTVEICRRLEPDVTKWLCVAFLYSKGIDPTEGARRLNLNPWVYQNRLLPTARWWGYERLLRLLKCLRDSDVTARQGVASAWDYFTCSLLAVCDSVHRS
jgi:DNA polymerase III delta subunit